MRVKFPFWPIYSSFRCPYFFNFCCPNPWRIIRFTNLTTLICLYSIIFSSLIFKEITFYKFSFLVIPCLWLHSLNQFLNINCRRKWSIRKTSWFCQKVRYWRLMIKYMKILLLMIIYRLIFKFYRMPSLWILWCRLICFYEGLFLLRS